MLAQNPLATAVPPPRRPSFGPDPTACRRTTWPRTPESTSQAVQSSQYNAKRPRALGGRLSAALLLTWRSRHRVPARSRHKHTKLALVCHIHARVQQGSRHSSSDGPSPACAEAPAHTQGQGAPHAPATWKAEGWHCELCDNPPAEPTPLRISPPGLMGRKGPRKVFGQGGYTLV
jgi:hypothetical protein